MSYRIVTYSHSDHIRQTAVCAHCPRRAHTLADLVAQCNKTTCLAPLQGDVAGVTDLGGGWYELPSGEKVQGHDNALRRVSEAETTGAQRAATAETVERSESQEPEQPEPPEPEEE